MKRIWIVAFEFIPFPGGQGSYAAEMARAFTRLGHTVTVIAPRYPELKDELEDYEIRRVFEHQQLNFAATAAILREVWAVQPNDIVLAADIRAALVMTLLRPFKRFHKITMFHGGEVKRSAYSFLARVSNRMAAAFSQVIVGNSTYTVDLVKRYVGGSPRVTLLGVGASWFQSVAGPFENEVLRSIPPDVVVICTVARLESRKGHLTAMKALRQVADTSSVDFRYVICGKKVYPDYADQVLKAVEEFPQRFLYVGVLSQQDVARLYARSRIMLLPAQDEPGFVEGFGLVITEAGAQRCPSISTRVGGIPDAIIDRKTGILCDPDDLEAFSRTIARLLNNPDEVRRLGEAARDYAATLTWESTAERTIEGIT